MSVPSPSSHGVLLCLFLVLIPWCFVVSVPSPSSHGVLLCLFLVLIPRCFVAFVGRTTQLSVHSAAAFGVRQEQQEARAHRVVESE